MKRLFSLFALLGICLSASAWSKFGHEVIVELAKRHMTERAKANVAKYMPYDITTEAVWMDDHRKDKDFAYTSSWHVYNTDEHHEYDPNPRLYKGDAIHALKIADYNLSRQHRLSDSTIVMNLRMLLHFTGDMHCPTHSYVPGPRCFWPCELNGQKFDTFHKVYDRMPAMLHPNMTPAELAALLDNCRPAERKKICKGTLHDWAKECGTNNCQIYKWNPHLREVLDPNTVELSRELVDLQVRNAGYRLAHLLNHYFGK